MAVLESLGSGWVFVGMLVLVVFVSIALVQKKQAIATKLAIFTSLFLVLTISYVYISSKTKIGSLGDFFSFVFLYFSWLFSIFENVKTITAQVIRMDWALS